MVKNMQDLVSLLNKELTKKRASRELAQKRVVNFNSNMTSVADAKSFNRLTKDYLVATVEVRAFSEAVELVVENITRIENKAG